MRENNNYGGYVSGCSRCKSNRLAKRTGKIYVNNKKTPDKLGVWY